MAYWLVAAREPRQSLLESHGQLAHYHLSLIAQVTTGAGLDTTATLRFFGTEVEFFTTDGFIRCANGTGASPMISPPTDVAQ